MNHRSALDYGALSDDHNSDSEGFRNPQLVIVIFFLRPGSSCYEVWKVPSLITKYHSEDFTRPPRNTNSNSILCQCYALANSIDLSQQ